MMTDDRPDDRLDRVHRSITIHDTTVEYFILAPKGGKYIYFILLFLTVYPLIGTVTSYESVI
jgi:hypothetical protein